MDKILINLVIPSISRKYEVLVPKFLKIEQVIDLLTEALNELTQNRYMSSRNELLCSASRGVILEPSYTIQECGISNGDYLYLL